MRTPDQAFRKLLYRSMKENLTSIMREIGETPKKAEVESVLIEEYEKLLGRMEEGEVGPAVRELMAELEEEFTSPDLVSKKGLSPRTQVKVAGGVRVIQRLRQGPEGVTRVTMQVKNNRVRDIAIASDAAFLPGDVLHQLERILTGVQFDRDALRRVLGQFYKRHRIDSEHGNEEDLLNTILAE